jgi:hypothetical protein
MRNVKHNHGEIKLWNKYKINTRSQYVYVSELVEFP